MTNLFIKVIFLLLFSACKQSPQASESPVTPNSKQSCSFNGQTISHSNSALAFETSAVPVGSECNNQTRVCIDGTLTGSFAFASCQPAEASSCIHEGQSIANGANASRIRFESRSVEEGAVCASQTQTALCNNGTLAPFSGSYTFDKCDERTNQVGPTRIPSFGPNGSHWPNLVPTPFPYDNTVPHVIQAAANWTDIKAKLQAVTVAQANAGTLILVAPGQNISTPSGTPEDDKAYKRILINIGSKAWTKRVTIAPRDGFGSVSFDSKLRFENLHGVALTGFVYNSSVRLFNGTRSAFAWSLFKDNLVLYSTDTTEDTHSIELVEVVLPTSKTSEADTANIFDIGGKVNNIHVVGSYFAPRYLPSNSDAHVDSFQYGASCDGQKCKNRYTTMFMTDTIVYASANAAVQTGRIDGLIFDHSMILAGGPSLSRYPKPSGVGSGAYSAINGSGINLQAKDSIFYGPLAINDALIDTTKSSGERTDWVWTKVENTTVSSIRTSIGTNTGAYQTNIPKVGAFTVDANLESKIEQPPKPTASGTDPYLKCIWLDRLGDAC